MAVRYWAAVFETIPLSGLPEQREKTLVLPTTKPSSLSCSPGIVHGEPSRDLSVASWNYSNPNKIDDLYAIGKKDGSAFLKIA